MSFSYPNTFTPFHLKCMILTIKGNKLVSQTALIRKATQMQALLRPSSENMDFQWPHFTVTDFHKPVTSCDLMFLLPREEKSTLNISKWWKNQMWEEQFWEFRFLLLYLTYCCKVALIYCTMPATTTSCKQIISLDPSERKNGVRILIDLFKFWLCLVAPHLN